MIFTVDHWHLVIQKELLEEADLSFCSALGQLAFLKIFMPMNLDFAVHGQW